ncbi:MAG: DUF2254 domain-containing protein [Actinobacteria bacterium]|nr:DUF2254 domain-containing protein [Actinomycetota bacterium]
MPRRGDGRVHRETGSHVTEGRPVGWVAAAGTGVNLDAYQRAVGDAMVIDRERKIEHDIGFGLRQLADIAGRGLSPSLNDPYSAVQRSTMRRWG